MKKRKIIIFAIMIILLIVAIISGITMTNAAGNTAEPETEQTFTEDGDGYYIWVRAVDHAGNKGPWSEAQRVWIDNKGPSAPVITGGSSEYALSRTISVSTAADDSGASGVAYYEYYKKSGSDKPADTVAGTQVTTSATSQTFNTNIAGEYVFFRAIDVVGNKGAWSEGQQVYIDVNKPTITVKQASLTITQGQNYAFKDYFTVAANGTNTSYTTTYKVGSTAYTNTSTLAVGTHTVTCTATKTGGNSESATMTLTVKSSVPTTETILVSFDGSSVVMDYAFVVPEGVKILKVSAYNSKPSNYTSSFGVDDKPDSGSSDWRGYVKGQTSALAYVQVTAGKTYYMDIVSGVRVTLSYSTTINNTTPSMTGFVTEDGWRLC